MKKIALLTALLPISALADYSQPSSNTNKKDALPESYFYLNTGLVEFKKDLPNTLIVNEETTKPNFGLGLGYHINQYLAAETFYRYSETEFDISSQLAIDDFSIQVHQLGAAIVPSTAIFGQSGIEIFAKLGASFAKINTADLINNGKYSSESGGLFEAGAGIQWNSHNDVLVRFEYTNVFADAGFDQAMENTSFDGFQLSVGYSFY